MRIGAEPPLNLSLPSGHRLIAHNPAKRRGWVALNARRLRDFNTLRAMRGGFSEGCRNNAAKVYAWLLRCNAVSRPDALGIVGTMAAQCRPKLDKGAVKDAVNYSKRMRQMRDQTISDWLKVTPEEAEMLDGLPPAGLTRIKPIKPSKTSVILARRAAIQAIIAEMEKVPTVREMGKLLVEQGHRGNHQTVQKDYRALGINSERTRDSVSARKQAEKEMQPPLELQAVVHQ